MATDTDLVFHRLRYFLLAATVAFVTLATLVMFNYRQSVRNYEAPQNNTHILCSALVEILLEVDVDRSINLPGECTPAVLADHRGHEDD